MVADDLEYINDPMFNIIGKKLRKMNLDSTLLHRQKIIVEAKRERNFEDTLVSLKQKNECGSIFKKFLKKFK